MNPLEIVAVGIVGVVCIVAVAGFLNASQIVKRGGNKGRYSSADNAAGFSAGVYSHSSGDGCSSDGGGGGGDC